MNKQRRDNNTSNMVHNTKGGHRHLQHGTHKEGTPPTWYTQRRNSNTSNMVHTKEEHLQHGTHRGETTTPPTWYTQRRDTSNTTRWRCKTTTTAYKGGFNNWSYNLTSTRYLKDTMRYKISIWEKTDVEITPVPSIIELLSV